jgi:Ribosomal L28e protein family
VNYQQLSKVFHAALTVTSESNLAPKMQVDEVIWQVINHQFCSFKTKIARERTFCQNPYNVSGLCIRRYDRVYMML